MSIDFITVKSFVEIIAILMWPFGLGIIFWLRWKSQMGTLGARVIQLTAVVMLFPAILVLALEKIIDGATVGTLIGGLIGYVLSGIGEYQPKNKNKEHEKLQATPSTLP